MKKILVAVIAALFIISCVKQRVDSKTIPDSALRQAAVDALNELDEEDALDELPDCDTSVPESDCEQTPQLIGIDVVDTGAEMWR